MMVKCDIHEDNKRLEKFKDYCQKEDINYITTTLPIGDYLFINNDNMRVIFEYKTIQDFIGSILEYRVFNQAISMAENYCYHYIIIVGDYNKEVSKYYRIGVSQGRRPHFTHRMFNGAITSLNTISHVLRADNINDAFDLMFLQARKCFIYKRLYRHDNRLPKGVGQWLVCNVPGIADTTAGLIEDNLRLKTLDDLLNVSKEDLVSIRGIGDKTACKILERIK